MADASIAQLLFDATHAEHRLDEALCDVGVPYESLGWDYYDGSLEIRGVDPAYRLSPEAYAVIHKAGFAKVYVNHADKWETHYGTISETPSAGWRVSYPHKREDGGKIWVEAHCASWPQEWFDTGYVLIKPTEQFVKCAEPKA